MSIIINIHTAQNLVYSNLFNGIKRRIPNLQEIIKSEEGRYFYAEGTSIRGIDFWEEDGGYEIKVNAMSSKDDYKIANAILGHFMKRKGQGLMPDLKFFRDGEPITENVIWFENSEIDESFNRDCIHIRLMSKISNGPVTIFGPTREMHIGEFTLNKVQAETQGWEKRLHDLLLEILYKLPKNESNNIMAIDKGDGEEEMIMKSISWGVNYILGKYDYLCMMPDDEEAGLDQMLVFTNDVLNENLPASWTRMDDYNIVAPALSEQEYFDLMDKLKAFDCKKEAFGY